MAYQIAGNSNTVVEVETNTRAMRMAFRPNDITTLGAYSIGLVSGLTNPASAGQPGTPLISMRYGGPAGTLALVKRFIFASVHAVSPGIGDDEVQLCNFNSWTVDDSGGNSATLTGDNNQLRASMAASNMSIHWQNTAAYTNGTRTFVSQIATGRNLTISGVGAWAVPPTTFLDVRAGDMPFILAPNEGLIAGLTVRAGSANIQYGAHICWDEVTTF